jgi:hypothetical protein
VGAPAARGDVIWLSGLGWRNTGSSRRIRASRFVDVSKTAVCATAGNSAKTTYDFC